MLYNIYYSDVFAPEQKLFVQEKKECDNLEEATLYAARRCVERQFEYERDFGEIKSIFVDGAYKDEYLIEHKASAELMDAIGNKQYCMASTEHMRFYAVPVEDDKLISEAFKDGSL